MGIVTVETLAIGNAQGPRVYLVCRRVGKHLDVEEMPDEVTNACEAHAFAACRWKVPECDVKFTPLQIVDIES